MIRKIDIERRWLIATMAIACLYGTLALRLAFQSPNLVQDDARQHVFWMRRFVDPTLFPNDLIADYFQAVAPAGYKLIYWIFARVGVDPLLLSKIFPAAIGLFIAYLTFRLFMELMPNPRGAFVASVLLGQLIWLKDDVISATPRAFICPLFLGFLLFVLQRRLFPSVLMVALQALVCPQAAFVSIGVLALGLIQWQDRHLCFTRDRRDYVFFFAALFVFAAAILPFASSVSRYGPVITGAEARTLQEFQRHGRSQFFVPGLSYWTDAPRSGLLPNGTPPHVFVLAIAAPLCLMFARKKFQAAVLLRAALAATLMWGAAHLLLFKLHLPGRYSQWLFQILFAIGAAATIALIWDWADNWREQLRRKNSTLAVRAISIAVFLTGATLIAYPHAKQKFPDPSYVSAQPRELYEFLSTQPKQTVIATLRNSASLAPVFARRSVLVSAEHAIPYHKGYYEIIRRRGQDLLRAHLTPRREELRAFIEKYHVDLIIVRRIPVTPQVAKKLHWFGEIADQVESNDRPALLDFIDCCKIWENNSTIVLDAHRVAQTIQP
jgi:hypothetical protein